MDLLFSENGVAMSEKWGRGSLSKYFRTIMVKRCNDSKFVCGYKHILRLGRVGGKERQRKRAKRVNNLGIFACGFPSFYYTHLMIANTRLR